MRKTMTAMVSVVVLLATVSSAMGELKLPSMFTSGAVLQQQMPVPVWGQADPNAQVEVAFAGQIKATQADGEGKWLVKLDPLQVSKKPTVLTVSSGDKTIELQDVLVGEVWFCSGQSNMEMVVNSTVIPEDLDPDQLPMIRHIKVPHVRAPEPADDFDGSWQVCDANTFKSFTAVGFYFACRLEKELDVPVGLIGCNWGGTRIEPWTPPNGFDMVDELDATTLKDTSTMFNGMVAPVLPYAIRGALWYQGESNGGEGETYFLKKKAMVGGWRKLWNQGPFPFYLVQLASFQDPIDNPAGGNGFARLREAQLKTVREIPNTGMAVITDIGEAKDIHPKNKFDVGNRLALWALAKDYGYDELVYSGPLYKSMKVEGDKIRITFDHVGSGLKAAKKSEPRSLDPPLDAEKLEGFAIAGADQKWHWAEAVIDGDTVVVTSEEVAEPVAVRYGFSMNPDRINLYNKENLPASPFRTDAW